MLLHSWFRTGVRCVLWLVGIVAASGGLRAQPTIPVTGLPEDLLPGLRPILQAAATRSPEAVRNSIEVEKADARRIIGASVLWPSVGGSARFAQNTETVSGNSGTSNTASGFFYNFTLNQPVYQWGALKAQADHEKIGAKIAERQYAQAYRDLLVAIRRDYLALVVQKAALATLRLQLTYDEAAVENQKQRLKEGLAFAAEVALAESVVEQHKLDIDMAAAAYGNARQSLLRLSGLSELPDEAIPADFSRPKPDTAVADSLLQAFTHGGVGTTLSAQVYEMWIKQNEQDYIIAKHRLHPKFSIFAGYDVRSETLATASGIDQVSVRALSYGIRADWALFDGWATKGSKLQALASKRANEQQLKMYVANTAETARTQRQQLDFAARGLDISERSIVGARAVLKEMESEHAAGRKAPADVDQAKLALANAEAKILPARTEYLLKWTEFVSLVGADPAMNYLPGRYAR